MAEPRSPDRGLDPARSVMAFLLGFCVTLAGLFGTLVGAVAGDRTLLALGIAMLVIGGLLLATGMLAARDTEAGGGEGADRAPVADWIGAQRRRRRRTRRRSD